jgi:hypothetical protein
MTEETPGSSSGILTAAALALAALLILMDEAKPFTVIFNLDALPTVLRKRIEEKADGVIVTATLIRKRHPGDNFNSAMSEGVYQAIKLNRELDFFGLREKFEEEKKDE